MYDAIADGPCSDELCRVTDAISIVFSMFQRWKCQGPNVRFEISPTKIMLVAFLLGFQFTNNVNKQLELSNNLKIRPLYIFGMREWVLTHRREWRSISTNYDDLFWCVYRKRDDHQVICVFAKIRIAQPTNTARDLRNFPGAGVPPIFFDVFAAYYCFVYIPFHLYTLSIVYRMKNSATVICGIHSTRETHLYIVNASCWPTISVIFSSACIYKWTDEFVVCIVYTNCCHYFFGRFVFLLLVNIYDLVIRRLHYYCVGVNTGDCGL